MKEKKKILVIGAGPAGCSASYFIKYFDKDDNFEVELIDRLSTKNYKIYHDMCGEGVSRKILTDLKPLIVEGIVGKIKLIKEFYPGNIEIRKNMDGLLIDRPQFFRSITDEFIKLGGGFQRNTVKEFSQEKDKIKIKFSKGSSKYDYVVAADGANSLFRRNLGLAGRTSSLAQYIVDKELQKDTIYFYYDEKYEGDYMWEFPHNGKTKIGYPIIKGKIFKPKGKILVKQVRKVAYGGLDRYVYGRIMLVGDAACQANPITKGGIRAGIVAGKLAAKAIVDGNLKQYERDWLKTNFSSKLFNEAFEKLRRMSNSELARHIKPFRNVKLESLISMSIMHIKIFLFYKKYFKLYKTYELCDEVGW